MRLRDLKFMSTASDSNIGPNDVDRALMHKTWRSISAVDHNVIVIVIRVSSKNVIRVTD